MLEIDPHTKGCVLRVRARPGARRDEIVGPYAGALKVAVRAAPEKGKANEAIIELLAKSLRIKNADLTLASGTASQDKRILIHGLSPGDVRARLAL